MAGLISVYTVFEFPACDIYLNSVWCFIGWCTCVCIYVLLLVAPYPFGQYSLPTLNFRTSTKCVCIDLTEVTIASLTVSTVQQVILFHVPLSTI